jgi:1,4-alpha-glucan branching enzyme
MKATKSKTKQKNAKSPPAKPAKAKLAPAKVKARTIKASPRKKAVKAKAKAEDGVTIRVHAPSAHHVYVAGTFNGWNAGAHPLSPAEGGEWRGVLPLPVGRYEYLFVVDGTWIPDPSANENVPNEYGGWNSVLSVN